MKTPLTAVILFIFCLAVRESQAFFRPPCGQDAHVAFGVTLGINGNMGPFNNPTTMVFKHVYYNSGAYSTKTGIFTAPVKGAYYFSFSGHGHSSKPMGLQLMKNGHHVITAYNHRAGHRPETITDGIILPLEEGDHVSMILMKGTWISDNHNFHSTFVGYLLFPLTG